MTEREALLQLYLYYIFSGASDSEIIAVARLLVLAGKEFV